MTKEQARRRAEKIVAKMTTEEKISQLVHASPAIDRLCIKEYNWWNEAAHGVAFAGVATVFPQVIGLAASFDPALIRKIGDVISTEARAKYNKYIEYGDRALFRGLTFCAPNINIVRDPRWGRGQETFGEDPYLTANLATEYIKGLQGDGEFYKSAACSKHFAVHSGPEGLRHEFDAETDQRDLYETYLPAFEHTVAAGVAEVMGAYNRTNGEPCCASDTLLRDILRGKWGFDGCVISDAGAIRDIFEHHHKAASLAEAAALALKCGCDLNLGTAYKSLKEAYAEGLVTEEEITRAAVRAFTIRVMLGEFEDERPYSDIAYDALDCPAHRELNLEAARQSLVLLKNDGILPLDPEKPQKIAVIGPNSNSTAALTGNYNGRAAEYITPADGVRRVFKNADVRVAFGSCLFDSHNEYFHSEFISEGRAAASRADAVILCLGLDCSVEGEEMPTEQEDFIKGDKKALTLPDVQIRLAEAVCDECENVIVVIESGSAIDIGERLRGRVKAIVQAWYPGGLGGLAIAELLAGKFSPSGRLPVTFYRADSTLPDFSDYSMEGRTYRFIREKPLYPFGYGLGYTGFEYKDLEIISSDGKTVRAAVTVTNTGGRAGLEKVQFYASFTDSRTRTPNFQLCALECVKLEAGESARVSVDIDRYWLKAVLPTGERVDPDGEITLYAGGCQPDERSRELCGDRCVKLPLGKI